MIPLDEPDRDLVWHSGQESDPAWVLCIEGALKQKLEAFIHYFNRTMAKPFKWTSAGKPLHGPAIT